MAEEKEAPGVGHNSGDEAEAPKQGSVGGIAPEVLRAYIERVERLEEEKKAIGADIREVYAEAKGNGFDPKIMRKLVSLRKMDKSDRQEEGELLQLYARAIGMDDLAALW